MTKRNAIPRIHGDSNVILLSNSGDGNVIMLNGMAMGDGAPEWVHLLPAGKIETVDKRGPFLLDAGDAAAVITNSLKSSPDGKLVIDINHATDVAAPAGGASPAQGWIEELQHRADGLYGRVSWTEAGKAALADRAYRFISPVIVAAKSTGKVVAVLRASLTNNPNLRGLTPVLNATQNTENDMDLLKQLLSQLGLPDTADEQTALATVASLKTSVSAHAADLARIAKAVKAADGASVDVVLNAVAQLADPTKVVSITAVEELRTELNAASAELKSLKDGIARGKAEAFVDSMIAAGKPGVKPLRDHYVTRHMADAAAVEKELNAQISLTASGVAKAAPPADGSTALDEADAKAIQLLGISPDDYKKTKAALGLSQETL
jgi:phage I-like protein